VNRTVLTGCLFALALALACTPEQPSPTPVEAVPTAERTAGAPTDTAPEPSPESGTAEADPEDSALSGEAAHVIPFADRTSMGYLLLLPPGTKQPKPPTREQLQTLVRQAFPDRRRDADIDLLLTLIATEPHATDFVGELDAPEFAEPEAGTGGGAELDRSAVEQANAKRERERSFDLIGLHIEIVHLGIGDAATIPSSAFEDPILTRGLSEAERQTLLGRSWALLLRADYRNKHAVRGLRLHQTLVRVAADHYGALVHDPDTLETMNVATFSERRLRAAAGNVADQIAIVPFVDARDDSRLRLSTRGMRRFGAVDIELDGLPRDPELLQQASDLIAGLALALVQDGEVEASGFAVEVPQVIVVDGERITQSYATRAEQPKLCADSTGPRRALDCPGRVEVHLVERAPEPHDPEDHVVARIVAPRELSDAADYDHLRWVQATLARLFGER
jgi:hypothetical protein